MSTGHRRRFSPRVLPELHAVCAKKMLSSANQKIGPGTFFFFFLVLSGPKDDGKTVSEGIRCLRNEMNTIPQRLPSNFSLSCSTITDAQEHTL